MVVKFMKGKKFLAGAFATGAATIKAGYHAVENYALYNNLANKYNAIKATTADKLENVIGVDAVGVDYFRNEDLQNRIKGIGWGGYANNSENFISKFTDMILQGKLNTHVSNVKEFTFWEFNRFDIVGKDRVKIINELIADGGNKYFKGDEFLAEMAKEKIVYGSGSDLANAQKTAMENAQSFSMISALATIGSTVLLGAFVYQNRDAVKMLGSDFKNKVKKRKHLGKVCKIEGIGRKIDKWKTKRKNSKSLEFVNGYQNFFYPSV